MLLPHGEIRKIVVWIEKKSNKKFALQVCFGYTGIVESIHLTYVGIDVQAAQKPYYYTALNQELETISCGHGRLADVLSYLAGQSSALVAINGPVRTLHSEAIFSQGGLFGVEHTSVSSSHHNIDVEIAAQISPAIPIQQAGKKAPIWMERSLELVGEMKRLGYSMTDGSWNERAFFETNTDAAYRLITGISPYDSRTLEGRLQRQLLLYEFGFPLKDPMEFLEEFTRYRLRTSNVPLTQVGIAHELRALTAAATAWLMDNRPETLDHLGRGSEGEMILPKEFSRK